MASNGSPITNGDSQPQLNGLTANDQAQGRVAVHSFDPNASPTEKGAAAGKGRDQLKSANAQPGAGEKEVQIDTGHSSVVPTIVVEDTDVGQPTVTAEGRGEIAQEDNIPQPPGAMPSGPAPAIPDWYKVGWRAVSGIDAPPPAEGEEVDKGVLDLFLAEQYYGAWYHNAALIFFAVFATHFLTRFNLGWGWLFITLAICSTYYSTSMERVRRRARDDIQRELVKTGLASELESADWINNFLDRFWLIYEPVLSATIVSSVDQILSTNTPAFLDSLRLATFTLGTKAPRIDKVRTFPNTEDDVVMMDWGISFTPNDVSDMTPVQAQKKVNPKIVLQVRVGKGLATAAMPILLEDITFSGLMRIRMKLMNNFPHVQIVDICFLEKPVIDYVLKPIGGETFGFDISNIPGLSSFIREMTHGTLGPMMYDPNVFTLNLEQLLSGTPLDTAIGVVQITVQSARGIKGSKIGGGTPDPYVGININQREELARTKYKADTYNPTWMETKFLLVNNLSEMLNLNVYDFNDHRKNTLLGTASFELAKLQEDATQEGIHSPILKDGKDRGELRYDISYYPVLKPEEGAELPDTSVGIVRLTVHQAKDLDSTKSMSGDLNPLAKVFLGNNKAPIHTTQRFKHTNNPVWESPHEFLCADKASSVITIKVIDDRDFLKDPVVGYMSIKLTDLLEARLEAGRDWWPLSGCKSGKLRVSAEWKPLNMAGSLHGAEQYVPPIGVVRLHLQKATDVKNVEATLGGKSDPYMRVQVNNVTKGRTEVINNNLNPAWDQIIYIPVHSLKESLLLECMDYQHLTKDRSLGTVELHVSELAKESGDKSYPYETTGVKAAMDPIRLDKKNSYKGTLHYTAQFVPALALKGVSFEAQANEMEKIVEENDVQDGGVVTDGDSSDDESQSVPVGVTIVSEQNGASPKIDASATKTHTKSAKSTDTTNTVATTNTTDTAQTNGTQTSKKSEEGVEMSREELLQQQSGVVVFNVVKGSLSKKARLEVLLDDGYWPAFTTVRARSTKAAWEHIGEGFLKELDFGRVWLRLNDADEGDKDEIIAEWKGDAKDFLQTTLAGPETFTLVDNEDRANSTVVIESRYVPVPVTLEPRESVNNQGVLRVDLLDGREIHGIDRGGKSDPFAVFTLNGQKVFKSQTKKKTLNPEWNENFTASVPSRVNADFSVEIFDWNQIEQAKSLGSANIDLTDLEPFQAAERTITLMSSKHGEKGFVRVRLVFQPEIIAKSRKNTSTFSSAGRAVTQIGGLPIGATKGVLQGVTGVFKRGKDKDEEVLPLVPEAPSGQASQPVGLPETTSAKSAAFPSISSNSSSDGLATTSHDPGTLRVTVLDAKDMPGDSKPYATIRVGDKEYKTKYVAKTGTPEWNESFTCAAGPLTPKMFVWIYDHKTIGKDKLLGDGEVDIWRHIKTGSVSSADVSLELREGHGLLHLRLEFDPDTNPLRRTSSISSGERSLGERKVSIPSPSRFSMRGRRPGTDKDDE